MADPPLIEVRNVSKKYCVGLKRSLVYAVRDIGNELLVRGAAGRSQLRKDEFWALKDVSFEVNRGDSLALIGANGAGKSSLLKMINGLMKPDTGSITVRGRIAALIELGAGFNPILTGRENIYVNAAVLGISRSDIDRKLEAIIDFAELDRFIDMPLKSYSSGMRVRLGFAVAAQLEPDVLLIDEVLAVGDAAFRAKCYRRLNELSNNGTAFIMVSHNHHSLLTVCNCAVGIDKGEVFASGSVRSVIDAYQAHATTNPDTPEIPQRRNAPTSSARIRKMGFRDEPGQWIPTPRTGDVTDFCVEIEADETLEDVSLAVVIRVGGAHADTILAVTASDDDQLQRVEKGCAEYRLRLQPLGLPPGSYVAKVSISRPPLEIYDMVEAFQFTVSPGPSCGDSIYYNPRSWSVEPADSQQVNS